MFFDEGQADSGFLGAGLAVAGRAPEDGVGDIEVVAAGKADGGEHGVEQLAAGAAERDALNILLRAGGFADDHDFGFRVAVAEYGFAGGFFEGAAGEIAHGGFEFGQA